MILSLKLLFHLLIANTAGQILINEILFNPRPEGVDFVELYNNSDQIIDLQYLYIASLDRQNQRTSPIKISEVSRPFYPGTYYVLTVAPNIVYLHYPDSPYDSFIQMSRMPTLNNESGTLIILYSLNTHQKEVSSPQWKVLDSLTYHSTMHSPFLKNVKGISLERQDLFLPTNYSGNFRSAAIQSGGATPGLINSSNHSTEQTILLKSRIISPDYDGLEDKLEVQYNIPQKGLMGSLLIYNDHGQLISSLLRNTSIPSQGSWEWDGHTDRGTVALPGIYTLHIELYNAAGFRLVRRKSFVLAVRK